jgi:type I restriction enzyme S subunit
LLPKGWKWANITEVTSKITDGTHNSPVNLPIGDYKYVTAKNIKTLGVVLDNITYVSKEVHDEIYARCNPEKGDILYIKDGATTGIVTINTLEEPFSLLSSVALIKPIKEISNKFLCYFLQSPLCYASVRDSMKGVGITRITLKQIEKWDVPLPPLAEQHRIVTEIERWFSLINIIENNKEDLQTTIKQTKNKILDFAIHGKLVPQDPTDESAIELLKRINPNFTPCDNGHYPVGWIDVILGDIFYHNTGKALNSSNKEGVWRNYLTTSNVYWNQFDLSIIKQMPFKDNELEKCTVEKGDLLVCEGGDIGRSAIWNFDYNICIQNHIHRLRPKGDLNVLFYYYVLRFLKEHNLIGGKGIGLLGLSSNELHKIRMPLPPRKEQDRIVLKIEEMFSVLDNIQKALEA